MDDAPPNPWLSWRYVESNWTELSDQLTIHTTLTLEAIAIALAIAFPLAVLARNVRWLTRPILGITGVLYTVPSLALFVLVRNIIAGLEGVDRDVVDAARGLGYSRLQLLWDVEIPNALPSIVAGLRIATVTTVALVTCLLY